MLYFKNCGLRKSVHNCINVHSCTNGSEHNIAFVFELMTFQIPFINQIKQRTLIIGISSDILCPLVEQQFLASHLPNAELVIIDSNYGHDGFMVESVKISKQLSAWLG